MDPIVGFESRSSILSSPFMFRSYPPALNSKSRRSPYLDMITASFQLLKPSIDEQVVRIVVPIVRTTRACKKAACSVHTVGEQPAP